MDEITWTDPQLKARYERNLKAMEQRRAAHPELLNKWAVPYKVFTRSMFLVKSVFRVSSLFFFGFRHEECRPVVCFTGCPSCRT